MFFTPYSQVFFRLQRILTCSFIGCFVSSGVVVYVSIHENKQASIEQPVTANFVGLLDHISIWPT